jgi:hypothetical protein
MEDASGFFERDWTELRNDDLKLGVCEDFGSVVVLCIRGVVGVVEECSVIGTIVEGFEEPLKPFSEKVGLGMLGDDSDGDGDSMEGL